MLTHFPTPYPDELWASVLGRYYLHSGHLTTNLAMKELLPNTSSSFSTYMASQLEQFQTQLPNNWLTNETIIEKHTLYPYFSRFLSAEQKEKSQINMLNKVSASPNFMVGVAVRQYVPQNHFWRYCPLCAQEDIEKYGETYWHRIHQIFDIRICPVHKIFLNSTNLLAALTKRSLNPPVFDIQKPVERPIAIQEIEIAQMVEKMLNLPLDKEYHSPQLLLDKPLVAQKFRTPTGLQTSNEEIFNALEKRLYDVTDLGYGRMPRCGSRTQIESLIHGKKTSTILMIHMAWLLGMDADDLVAPTDFLPTSKIWENEVAVLYNAGWDCSSIAEKYGMPESTTKDAMQRLGFHVKRVKRSARMTKEDYERKKVEYREAILNVVKNSSLTLQDIRDPNSSFRKIYYWLKKHDKKWLEEMASQLPQRPQRGGVKYDWAKKDNELFPATKAYVDKCLDERETIIYEQICIHLKIPPHWLKKLRKCHEYARNAKEGNIAKL